MTQIDQDSPKIAKVSVIHLENADPQQVQKVCSSFKALTTGIPKAAQDSVLMKRETQTTTPGTTGFGTTGGTGGGGGGFGGGRRFWWWRWW